jgi:hypothetical protein
MPPRESLRDILAEARARARDESDGEIVVIHPRRSGCEYRFDVSVFALGREGIPNLVCGGCSRRPVVVRVRGGDFTWRGQARLPRSDRPTVMVWGRPPWEKNHGMDPEKILRLISVADIDRDPIPPRAW